MVASRIGGVYQVGELGCGLGGADYVTPGALKGRPYTGEEKGDFAVLRSRNVERQREW
jgi:hypothetical protein